MRPGFLRTVAAGVLCLACVLMARVVEAQPLRGVVVDQTGLPLPGAMVQLRNGDAVIASIATQPKPVWLMQQRTQRRHRHGTTRP